MLYTTEKIPRSAFFKPIKRENIIGCKAIQITDGFDKTAAVKGIYRLGANGNIGILILAGSKISDLQSSKNSENQFSGALRFVETIAQDLHVNKEDVYINTEAAKDGAIVKVGDQFYRVLTGDSPEHYLLEKMELQNPKVTIKEAE